ncbi:hypothetical protein HIM_02775 [Hirsutella minnesotensis 3608]|nr:hypothetical protein HIM_02775 [Hirsutella minnesotensis 3608]
MQLALGLALLASGAATAAGRGALRGSHDGVKNVAIIGAGAAGSSTAYHLQKYAKDEGLAVNVTIFEKTHRVGGRTLTVDAFDDPAYPVELGASIFVTINHILYNATKHFDLALGDMSTEEDGDITAIWDGERIVYELVQGTPWWREAGKLWWRYGLAPYKAVTLVKRVVGVFLKLYTEPYFPFASLTRRVYELGLERVTSATGEQFLAENKACPPLGSSKAVARTDCRIQINPDFAREIMQPATRVNYASNLAYIHGLETMVSFATEGAITVNGGNWQIFDNMVRSSGAALYRNTSVASISFEKGVMKPGAPRKYVVSTRDANAPAAAAEHKYPTAFDHVVIASPWQFSDIKADAGVLKQQIDRIPYTKLHVTLFTSPYTLHPAFFNLEPGTRAPSSVYTTLSKDETPKQGAEGVGRTGFYSISMLRRVVNKRTDKAEYLYKIFSAAPVTPEFLSDVLGAPVPSTFVSTQGADGASVQTISWYYPHWFHSYPIELPRVTFQDPIVGRGVYYTSGMESFISTMETSALMGMNVARLIADHLAGITRGAWHRPEEERVSRGDFFESVETEMGMNMNMMGQDEL